MAGAEARQMTGPAAAGTVNAMTSTLSETTESFPHQAAGHPVVEIVLPVYNEQTVLAGSVRRVREFAAAALPVSWHITIADNASTDASPDIACQLARDFGDVSYLRLDRKGRGLALHRAWSGSSAGVLVYMDIDLSTDLAALLPLIAPLVAGQASLATGSRLTAGASVRRGLKREVISRCYNMILRGALRVRFSDAQCGFKAIRADLAAGLLPLVQDQSWFFDTELLVLAERCGLTIHEVPVAWTDDPDSRVDIIATAAGDLRGVGRLRRRLREPDLQRRLAGIGSASPGPLTATAAAGRGHAGFSSVIAGGAR
jgi:glycosyltransferase involved in cell wall biosynthesis